MAMLGLTLVVGSLAVVVGIRGGSLSAKDEEYRIKEERLEAQLADEQRRAEQLEEERVYVQTRRSLKSGRFMSRQNSILRRWPRRSWGW